MLSLRARRTLIWKRIKHHWPVVKIVSHFRVNRDTFYYHWNNYKQYGWDGLGIKSKTPHIIHRIPADIANKILTLRKMNNRNEYAIASYLKRQGTAVSHSTVYRIMKSNGLINALSKPRQQRTFKRFSRKRPNSLWQTDLTLFGSRHMATFLDDHSRMLTGIDFISPTTESILSMLEQAMDAFGKPRQILSDHGTQYYDVHGGISKFTEFCSENKIKHIMGSIGHPQTTGKIERFFRTFKEEYDVFNSLEEFVDYYNNRRLHGAIGYLTPAEVYYGKK